MTKSHKKIIGITGGIGSGKSVVSRVLRLNGEFVYDCDFEAKILMRNNLGLKKELIGILGPSAYNEDGTINSPYVSDLIFTDNDLRLLVNKTVHTCVLNDFLRKASVTDSRRVFCESAILGSSGFSEYCDRIWCVEAPENVRIERVVLRNGLEISAIRKRMKIQEKEFETLPGKKIDRILNDGSVSVLEEVNKLIGDIMNQG